MLGTEIPITTIYNTSRKVRIAPGIESGDRVKLEKEGFYRLGSHDRGHHYVEIKIHIPKKLSKHEKKIFEELQEAEKSRLEAESKAAKSK